MPVIDPIRRAALERQLGRSLPPALLTVLAEQSPIVEGQVAFISAGRTWDVRTSFTLDDGEENRQLDRLYGLVGDVLPPGTLPVAADWADNFYCLVLAGSGEGQVVYWDHERDPGDERVELVANSLGEFFAHLVPDPDRPGA